MKQAKLSTLLFSQFYTTSHEKLISGTQLSFHSFEATVKHHQKDLQITSAATIVEKPLD